MIINIEQWNGTFASNMNSAIARSNSLKYKYQRFSSSSYKDIGVRKYMQFDEKIYVV